MFIFNHVSDILDVVFYGIIPVCNELVVMGIFHFRNGTVTSVAVFYCTLIPHGMQRLQEVKV